MFAAIDGAVPEDPAACYAVASALAYHATIDNFGAILTYLSRFHHREFAVVCVKDARSQP